MINNNINNTITTGAMNHWPALSKWNNIPYLRATAGPRTVPVEIGSHYLAEGWGQRLITFDESLDTYMININIQLHTLYYVIN
jgi:hypothetical protein